MAIILYFAGNETVFPYKNILAVLRSLLGKNFGFGDVCRSQQKVIFFNTGEFIMKNTDNIGLDKGQNVLPVNGSETAPSAATPDSTQITADSTSLSKASAPITLGDADNGKRGGNNIAVVLPSGPEPDSDKAPDPFDPEYLRLDPNRQEIVGKKIFTTIFCRKPFRYEWVQRHTDKRYTFDTVLIFDAENNEYYTVVPFLRGQLSQETVQVRISVAMNRNGDLFLWLVKLPKEDDRSNRWNDSALAAFEHALAKWVRVVSNIRTGCYDVYEAAGINIEPEWPDLTFQEILKLCFKDRHIDSLDHPFLMKLRGEA